MYFRFYLDGRLVFLFLTIILFMLASLFRLESIFFLGAILIFHIFNRIFLLNSLNSIKKQFNGKTFIFFILLFLIIFLLYFFKDLDIYFNSHCTFIFNSCICYLLGKKNNWIHAIKNGSNESGPLWSTATYRRCSQASIKRHNHSY